MNNSEAPKTNLLSMNGITLEWEDQESSSALYIKLNGRVIGIRATVSKVQIAPGTKWIADEWEILDCWEIDATQPKYRGPVGTNIGRAYDCDSRVEAKRTVDNLIKRGTLIMECVLEN